LLKPGKAGDNMNVTGGEERVSGQDGAENMLEMGERSRSSSSSVSRTTLALYQHFTAILVCMAGSEVITGGEGAGSGARRDDEDDGFK
jgi:preprotein translocase subunit SecG